MLLYRFIYPAKYPMRIQEINEAKIHPAIAKMSNEERIGWINFIMQWIRGALMQKADGETLAKWEEFSRVFPTGLSAPVNLYRLMTIPIKYADQTEFHMEHPAPGLVGSWTNTKVGLDCVAGVARDFAAGTELEATTARIAFGATIEPQNILATIKSMKTAFLSLTHDYEHDSYEHYPNRTKNHMGKAEYHPYLGLVQDDEFHDDLGYYQSLYQEYAGGPFRQSEHIVRTTPLDLKRVLIYRRGTETLRHGNDDPHN
jgi:hypothetical protein